MGANPFSLHLHVQLSFSPALLNIQVWHAELSLTSNHSHISSYLLWLETSTLITCPCALANSHRSQSKYNWHFLGNFHLDL